jgi:hypothetical protein
MHLVLLLADAEVIGSRRYALRCPHHAIFQSVGFSQLCALNAHQGYNFKNAINIKMSNAVIEMNEPLYRGHSKGCQYLFPPWKYGVMLRFDCEELYESRSSGVRFPFTYPTYNQFDFLMFNCF